MIEFAAICIIDKEKIVSLKSLAEQILEDFKITEYLPICTVNNLEGVPENEQSYLLIKHKRDSYLA